jgi:hypothetical protein
MSWEFLVASYPGALMSSRLVVDGFLRLEVLVRSLTTNQSRDLLEQHHIQAGALIFSPFQSAFVCRVGVLCRKVLSQVI